MDRTGRQARDRDPRIVPFQARAADSAYQRDVRARNLPGRPGGKESSARQGILCLWRPALLDYLRGYPVLRPDHPGHPPRALPGPKAQIRSPRNLAVDDRQASPPAARTTAKPRLGDRRNHNASALGFSAIDRLACGTSGYPDPRACHSTGDLLSSTGGRSRRAFETDGDRRKPEPSNRSSDRLAEEQLRPGRFVSMISHRESA